MNTNDKFYRSLVSSNTVENQELQTVSYQKVALNDIAVNEPKASPDAVSPLVTSLSFLGIGLILVGLKLKPAKLRKLFSFRFSLLKHHQHPPCANCRFFNKQAEPKCAVHPSMVLSIQAKNCFDYWARDSKTFSSKV
jgi:hypothetical protein